MGNPIGFFGDLCPSAKIELRGQLTDNNPMRQLVWALAKAALALGATLLAMQQRIAAAPPLTGSHESEHSNGAALDFLKPIVCRFDFEDDDVAPNSLPRHFVRNIAPSQGFPNFGAMRLSKTAACSGSTSFEFELAGGSMSASVSKSVIPILPMADYAVTVKVRTEGLVNSAARLVAWLHDKNGRIILQSRNQSPLIRTNGEWESLSVHIAGNFVDAADLVLELQLVQPDQVDVSALELITLQPQDVSGRAWFDDVVVVHVPRVSLSLREPGHLVMWPNHPTFEIRVNELTSQRLSARLRIFDINGSVVFDTTFPAPRGQQAGSISAPMPACGWYRAVLQVHGVQSQARERAVDFAIVRQPSRTLADQNQFGLILDEVVPVHVDDLTALATSIRGGLAVVPVWHRDSGSNRDQPRQIATRDLIERLMRADIDLIFALGQVPERLAAAAGVQTHDVATMLAMDPKLWRPYLDDLLVNFGMEVLRWMVGSTKTTNAGTIADIDAGSSAARRTLSEFVPDPHLLVSWPLEHEPPDNASPNSYVLSIPYEVNPAAVTDYLELWRTRQHDVVACLNQLPSSQFSPRQRVVDLMQRALHAWRAGAGTLLLESPWSKDDSTGAIMPSPAFTAWRTLAEQLNGRAFAGELSMPSGLHCWILKGQTTSDAALVAWCDAPSSPHARLYSQLADRSVETVDAFGNRASVDAVNARHAIPLTDMPLFINEVDLELVQFRSALAIVPDFVPAVTKVHEHRIVLENPWDVAISGVVRLTAADSLTLIPSAQEFAIPPRGKTMLPLQIIPDRSVVAGTKRIVAELTMHAEREHALVIDLSLNVGLKNIDLVATWSASRNPATGNDDLVISAAVTNKGEQQSNLDVYIHAENVSQNRRTIAALGPGETSIRTFRIADGMKLLHGRQVRVGVAERDGTTRLNQILTIGGPPHSGPELVEAK